MIQAVWTLFPLEENCLPAVYCLGPPLSTMVSLMDPRGLNESDFCSLEKNHFVLFCFHFIPFYFFLKVPNSA